MEKQRSFSIKPTRLLVYSFTISSSILFITIFSFWVFQSTSSIPQQPLAHFNSSKNISVSFKTIKSQALSGLSVNKSSLRDTQNKGFDNISRGSLVLVGKSVLRNTLSSKVGDGLKRVEVLSDGGERVEVEVEEKRRGDCDVSNGRWVYDESYPLYTNRECPFIDEGFNCEANGRLDRDYVKWRWQPHDCIIPRFNAVKMLELIRGKRLVFVGDSINRNQWESMLCLLRGAVKDPKRVYETHGRRISKDRGNYSFKFLDYKCTVEYYVTHFLVREGKARVNKKRIQTLRIDAIDRSSSRWKGADILVFNTAHWWSHYKTKSGVNYYQEGDQVHPHLDVSTAFRRALATWALWVDRHVTLNKTQVFFRSSAPSHFKGGQWNSGGHCREGIRPLNNASNTNQPEKYLIAEEVIKQMKTRVTFLNITSLSEFRIDGHPSIYGKIPAKETPSRAQDCSHWCLPGVPDTWNELLYFYLQSKPKKKFHGLR